MPRSGFPDDPLFDRQWGLRQIKAPAAWERGLRGSGAVIAVIDTGVDLEHPDLIPNLTAGADLSEGGQGQPPDCPAGPRDENFHGTFVAGLAAAATDNATGIAGVAPEAKIMPVRVVGDVDPGADAMRDRYVDAIRYAADHGADVINVSGGFGYHSALPSYIDAFNAAVAYAWHRGSVFVSVAGNDSAPACQMPAAATHAVCVAATDRSGLPVVTSNLPVHAQGGIAVRAPAGYSFGCDDQAVLSTSPPTFPRRCPATPLGYDQRAGTSAAAPHVAGAAALLAGAGLSNQQIVDCIKRTSSNRGLYDPIMGYGIIDADAASRDCVAG